MSNVLRLRRMNAIYYRSAPSLYRTCIRIVSRNIEYYSDRYDLSQLPWNIKTDLLYMNMRIPKGFSNEETIARLLTSNVRKIIIKSITVSDTILKCIATHCQHLQELFLAHGNYSFTHDGLCSSLRCLRNLRALQIVGSNEIDVIVIDLIGENCQQLRSLWLNDSPNINDLCANSIKRMPLVELNLGNTQITDHFLEEIENSVLSEHLRDICLRNCPVTKSGLARLNWNLLENINIWGTSIDDVSFIPSDAVYKTLNLSVAM